MTITYALYLVAFVCFLLASAGVSARINLVALGLACWVATLLL